MNRQRGVDGETEAVSLAPHKTTFKKKRASPPGAAPPGGSEPNGQAKGERMAPNVEFKYESVSESRCERGTFMEARRGALLLKPVPSAAAVPGRAGPSQAGASYDGEYFLACARTLFSYSTLFWLKRRKLQRKSVKITCNLISSGQ